jgi:drug/metabolite transporter (DMT)-like permease
VGGKRQPNTGKTGQLLPTVFVFATSVIWGLTFVTQKLAGAHMGAFAYNGFRFALGALSMLPVIFIFERTRKEGHRRTLLAGLGGGVILFFASNLQQFGIVLNKNPGSASEAGFITGLYIVFTPILGIAFGRRARPLTWLAAALAFGGLALMSMGPEGLASVKISDILLLAGAVFWALHILYIDRFARDVAPLRFAAAQFVVSAALSMAAAAAFETVSLQSAAAAALPLLFGGVFACGTAYTLQILGQRAVEPAKAAIIFALEAPFAALGETVWLGETMTAQKYVGGAVIFAAIILSQLSGRKRAPG